jgi:hypothetical protein
LLGATAGAATVTLCAGFESLGLAFFASLSSTTAATRFLSLISAFFLVSGAGTSSVVDWVFNRFPLAADVLAIASTTFLGVGTGAFISGAFTDDALDSTAFGSAAFVPADFAPLVAGILGVG